MTRLVPIPCRSLPPRWVCWLLPSGLPAPDQCRGRRLRASRIEAALAARPDDGRYTFHRVGDGFVRLDSRTGQVSQCGWSAGTWSCKTVPDERTALESEIARLQNENAALKKSLLSRGLACRAA